MQLPIKNFCSGCTLVSQNDLLKLDLKMCSKLIVRGADVNYVNRNGNTALHLMIEHNLKDAVEFLLDKGAN